MPPECSPGKPPPPLNNNLKKNKIKRNFTSSIYFKRKLNNCHNFQQLINYYLFFILIFLPFGNAQFGEIASAISSLVAGGAGSGLAGGLGTGLGSAIGSGASAGAGAAGALGNIGQLYQLAQAALQLTGTGVGIANQASESAWFPVVVENAARMNKDFQDRLFNGIGTNGNNGGIKSSSSSKTTNIGSEYGKEFGGEGSGGDGGIEINSLNGRNIINPELPSPSSSNLNLISNLLTTNNNKIAKLLPGEIDSSGSSFSSSKGNLEETNNNNNFINRGNKISTGKKFIGIGSIEEIPLSPLNINEKEENNEKELLNTLLPGESFGEIKTTEIPKIIKKEKIKLIKEENKENKNLIEQIETDFNIDENNKNKKMEKLKEENEIEKLLEEQLIPSNPLIESLNMTLIEKEQQNINSDLSQMVPELKKLIGNLKMGNLTEFELKELEEQLKENNEGKENNQINNDEEINGDDIINNKKEKPINKQKQKASRRNLAALRRGLFDENLTDDETNKKENENFFEEFVVDGQNDPILRKIIDFRKPPIILSLERPRESKHYHKHKYLNNEKRIAAGVKLLHEGGGNKLEKEENELLTTTSTTKILKNNNSIIKKTKKKHKKIKSKIEGIKSTNHHNYQKHKSSSKRKKIIKQIYSSTQLPTTKLFLIDSMAENNNYFNSENKQQKQYLNNNYQQQKQFPINSNNYLINSPQTFQQKQQKRQQPPFKRILPENNSFNEIQQKILKYPFSNDILITNKQPFISSSPSSINNNQRFSSNFYYFGNNGN